MFRACGFISLLSIFWGGFEERMSTGNREVDYAFSFRRFGGLHPLNLGLCRYLRYVLSGH